MNPQSLKALCALFDCIGSVHHWAHQGHDEDEAQPSYYLPTLVLSPTEADLYPPHFHLQRGRRWLTQWLEKSSSWHQQGEHAFHLMILAEKLRKKPEYLQRIRERLQQLPAKLEFFEGDYPSVVPFLAETYAQCISTLGVKLRVHGRVEYLTQSNIAAHIRTQLLFGVRAATWWQQWGGSRWHFLRRQNLIQNLQTLDLEHVSS